MKHLLSLLFMCAITICFAQTDKRLKGLEKELEAALEATEAPGFAVAIVEGNQVIYSKGFGYSDVENKIKADANTLYAIGSCTKSFTSALLGILADEDKLSLDDNPRQYLPNLEFYNADLNNTLIIKDLMSHRTGIPRHDAAWYLFPTKDVDSMIGRIKYQEPFTGIRQQWYYNNFMFFLQGAISEKIAAISWEDHVKKAFFEPLGMSRSNANIQDMKMASNRAIGYETKDDGQLKKMGYYDISTMGAAGSINSSVNDMTKWLITWMNEGQYNGKQIVPENYVIDAISSHSVVNANLPDEEHPDMFFVNYGYSWFLSSYRGFYRVEHGGNIDGFSANTAFFPSEKIGIVVLVNQNGSSLPNMVRNIVADRMLGTERSEWTKEYLSQKEEQIQSEEDAMKNEIGSQVANTQPSHSLDHYTGRYENPGYGEFKIELKNDSLFAKFKLMEAYLQHYHYDVFELLEKTEEGFEESDFEGLRINFQTNDAGDISKLRMKIEPTLEGIEFNRTPNSIDVTKDTLQTYVGTYELAGIELKFYTKDKGDILYLFVEGQPEYELIATASRKFSLKNIEGFKVEFVDNKGKDFEEVLMYQPNGTFKASRKK